MRPPRTPRKKTKNSSGIAGKSSRVIEKFTIKPVKGRPLRTDLDNIVELIAEVEGDDFR